MPLTTFETHNKAKNVFDFPKLSLEKGQTARILAIEKQPQVEYTHTLRMPRMVDGVVVMEKVKGKDGSWSEKVAMDFVGRHICIGSYDVLSEKGVDVKGCYACKASTESTAIEPPKRRFAMNVMQYGTVPGGFDLAEPFSVSVKAWAFTENVFGELVDAAIEWGSLLEHDLKLGPCESKQFQKFKINVAGTAAWLANEEYKKQTAATYKNNKCPDLLALIGRKLTPDQVLEDVEKVLARHKEAFGKKEDVPVAEASNALDLEGILSDTGQSSGPPEHSNGVAEPQDLEAFLNEGGADAVEAREGDGRGGQQPDQTQPSKVPDGDPAKTGESVPQKADPDDAPDPNPPATRQSETPDLEDLLGGL